MKRKNKIMKVRPEVSDGEIQSFMNFDAVIAKYADASSVQKNRHLTRAVGLIAAGLIILFGSLYWILSDENPVQPAEDVGREHQATNVVTKDTTMPQEMSFRATTPSKTIQKTNEKTVTQNKKRSTEKVVVDTLQSAGANNATSAVYVQAEPKDGYPALYKYFAEQLKYPEEARDDSTHGVVIVVFTINEVGEPEKISIEQSLGPAFDRETLQTIKNMPPWKPATYNHEPVNSKISLPLTFQIKKIKTP
jgi:TonB family protein